MNKIVIVFTINDRFVTPTYIAIQSLFEHANDDVIYECLVLSNDISKKNESLLKKLEENTCHLIKFVKVDDSIIYAPKVSYTWPQIVYWRLYLCDILSDYDKVIYSDVDVLFQGDLSEVWNLNIEDCEIAAVAAEKNNSKMIMHQYYQENIHEYMFWDGFMVMNLKKMRGNNWTEKCSINIKKYQSKLKMFDLEIINLTAEHIKTLPFRYVFLQSLYDAKKIEMAEEYSFLKNIYTLEYLQEEKENIVIIHYAGKMGKPWLRKEVPKYYLKYMNSLPRCLKWKNNYQRLSLLFRNGLRRLYRRLMH